MPSSTKNNVYIQPMLATRQSQVVVKSASDCRADLSRTPSALDNGSQTRRMRVDTDRGEKKPPAQHSAAVNIALRGPPSSTQRPNTAADPPRNTMAIENIQPSSVSFQSPARTVVMPSSLVIGRLNTLSA